jgi:hypothetical protein
MFRKVIVALSLTITLLILGISPALAVQGAIDTCIASGGGTLFFRPGHYPIDALTLAMNGPTVNCNIIGGGRGNTIFQGTSAQDCLTIGRTGAENADNIRIQDLSFDNCRNGIVLNNTLHVSLDHVGIHNVAQNGLYGIGQNESLETNDLEIDGAGSHCIYFGDYNGGTALVLDFPELQKAQFKGLTRCAHASDTGVLFTAGIMRGNQIVSGDIHMDQLLSEGNKKGTLELNHVDIASSFDHITNEDNLDADNLYAVIKVNGTGLITISYSALSNDQPRLQNPKYGLEVDSGIVVLRCSATGAMRTADIYVGDKVTLADDIIGGGTTTGITLQGAGKTAGNLVKFDVRDSAGIPF